MNILVISSMYPADDIPSSCTPVVHYIAKEWVKQGHNVKVCHSPSVFPELYYKLARLIGSKFLSSKLGYTVILNRLGDKKYSIDNVDVARFVMRKIRPHSRFKKSEISAQVEKIVAFCKSSEFSPDLIVGHWLNPQLELLAKLSGIFPNAKTALTLHEGLKSIQSLYSKDWGNLSSKIGKVGFRNAMARKEVLQNGKLDEAKTYLCLSGIPDIFLEKISKHSFSENMSKFSFVGTLFKRKFPEAILKSVLKVGLDDFQISYVGEGECFFEIEKIARENAVEDKIKLLGRIPRPKIRAVLENSDFMIMISKDEAYGLVYLEAMAFGCITIASRGEGFDGIIKHGENGFLCGAGDVDELAELIKKIQSLPSEEIARISENAMETARKMTDSACAKKYLEDISS